MPNCFIFFMLVFVHCNGKRIPYGKGNVISLNNPEKFNLQEDDCEIVHEGSDHSNYLKFQYDGVNFYDICSRTEIVKLWSSVEVTIDAEEDEFKMKVVDTDLTGDESHDHATGFEHLKAAFNHFTDAIQHCRNALSQFVLYHNDNSVRLNPIGQHHFVKVWYHGTKTSTNVTVTVKEKVIELKFPLCLFGGIILLIFAHPEVHPIARNVRFLYNLCAFLVGIICLPISTVYIISRLLPWAFVSHCVFCVGCVLMVTITYYFTLEQPSEFSLIFTIFAAVLAEISLQPLRSFLKRSDELLQNVKFIWGVQFGAMFMIVMWSTQCYEVSALLYIVVIAIIKRWSSRNKGFKTLKKKLSSQELEHVTVVK